MSLFAEKKFHVTCRSFIGMDVPAIIGYSVSLCRMYSVQTMLFVQTFATEIGPEAFSLLHIMIA